MNPFFPPLLLAILFAFTTPSIAGTGSLSPSDFGGDHTIIFAESTEANLEVSAKIIKIDDWSTDTPSEGSVKLPFAVVDRAFDLDFSPPRHEFALYKDGNKPTDGQLKEAQVKDKKERAEIYDNFSKALEEAGLTRDPKTETIVYFYSGRAKVTVTTCLQGNLKPGDEIEVRWENVQRTVSCPPILPYEGSGGWVLGGEVAAGEVADWKHGFLELEDAEKAKAEHLKSKVSGESAPE